MLSFGFFNAVFYTSTNYGRNSTTEIALRIGYRVRIARTPITQIELSPGLLAGLKTTCASGNKEKFLEIGNL